MIARATALLLTVTLWLAAGVGAASACSCERPPTNVRGYEQQRAWEFARAGNVVRGKIISASAGEGVVRDNRGVVLITMRVDAVLKGDVPTGDVTIVTSASSASCGLGERLLSAAEAGTDLSLELFSSAPWSLTKFPPREFHASWCGYFQFGSDPTSR